jgi:twinkle protein
MSECIERLPHSCGSSDGLQVFQQSDGSFDGYCFSCGKVVDDPYGDKEPPVVKKKSARDKALQVQAITKLGVHALPTRMLKASALKYFGCRVALSEQDGETPVGVYLPYGSGKLTGYKFRDLLDKSKMWIIGATKDADMFGWGRAIRSGERTLYITEGEFDAVALYQILKDGQSEEYKDSNPAVVSLKNGASGAVKDISRHLAEIRQRFEKVVLAFDDDEPGRAAAEQVCKIASDFMTVTLPCKDANECLMEGASKACRNAVLFRSSKPKNTRLLLGSSLRDVAKEPPEMGLSWPWDKMTDLTRGIRLGETIYFGAGVKMGKSELVNAIAKHLIVDNGKKVLLVKPEEATPKTYKMLVGKAAGRIFHDPKIPFDQEAWEAAEPSIGDNVIITDAYQFVGWEQLKEDIRYAVIHYGVEYVIIDPITALINQLGSGEANDALVALTAELSAMAKDMNFTAFIFCHLKAPQGDSTPHERGGKVYSTQFAGSRAMMRSCNYMIGMRGNKDPELPPEERNMRKLEVLEDREFGVSDVVDLYWDNKTGLFNEVR